VHKTSRPLLRYGRMTSVDAAARLVALCREGRPIDAVKTRYAGASSCLSNPAAIRWPTYRRPASLQTAFNGPAAPPVAPASDTPPGTSVRAGEQGAPRGAWQHIDLRSYASELQARVAFAWPAMDAFHEEGERIMGHAADSYHRIDIRQSSRSLVVRHRGRAIADTRRPLVLYESGFAPRCYIARGDVDEPALTPVIPHGAAHGRRSAPCPPTVMSGHSASGSRG
jgi:Domain of unknown function (DUF427)